MKSVAAPSSPLVSRAVPSQWRLLRALADFFRGYRDFFAALFKYREYLKQSVARDLRKRYKRSSLGYLWSMLNPLCMMIIISVVFSHVMRIKIEHYSVFLFIGMLPWQYFSTTVNGSLDSVRGNMNIIDHVPVPKYIFALSIALSNFVNLLLALIPLFGVMLVVGHPIEATVLYLPALFVPLFFVSLGGAMICAAANVFFDDTRHLVGVLLQALYYLTPVLYGRDHLPDWLVGWLEISPMFHIIEMFRDAFFYGRALSLSTYSVTMLSSMFVLGAGLWVFKRADSKFLYFI